VSKRWVSILIQCGLCKEMYVLHVPPSHLPLPKENFAPHCPGFQEDEDEVILVTTCFGDLVLVWQEEEL